MHHLQWLPMTMTGTRATSASWLDDKRTPIYIGSTLARETSSRGINMTNNLNKKRILKIILSIFLPPAAAYWQVGPSGHFFINLILTFLGWIFGIVHALLLVLTDKKS